MNVYQVTLRWYVETPETLTPRSVKKDKNILNILRHRLNGTPSCSTCPTRSPENHTIVKTYNSDNNKPIYMSIERIVDKEEVKITSK
ncbi:MAG: hypothetical protein V3U16_02335 [Candidatus Neomarinimicrobiota bacterium]